MVLFYADFIEIESNGYHNIIALLLWKNVGLNGSFSFAAWLERKAFFKQKRRKTKIKLSDFNYMQGFAKVRAYIEVNLSSVDDSWSKTYEETDTSGWSAGRAFGSVIYHTIEKLLKDPEVLTRMKM